MCNLNKSLTMDSLTTDFTLSFSSFEDDASSSLISSSSSSSNSILTPTNEEHAKYIIKNNATDGPKRDEDLAKIEMGVLGLIFTVTLIGNIIVILGIYFRAQKMSRMYYFILHLTIADLITAIFNVATQFFMELTWPEFYGGNALCKIIKYSQILGPYSSSYVLVMTAFDRYQAICYPLSTYKWKSKRSKLMLGIAWSIAFAFCIPQLFIFSLVEVHPGIHDCYATFTDNWGAKAYVTWYSISFFIVPLLLLVYAYVGICRALWLNTGIKGLDKVEYHPNNSIDTATTTTSMSGTPSRPNYYNSSVNNKYWRPIRQDSTSSSSDEIIRVSLNNNTRVLMKKKQLNTNTGNNNRFLNIMTRKMRKNKTTREPEYTLVEQSRELLPLSESRLQSNEKIKSYLASTSSSASSSSAGSSRVLTLNRGNHRRPFNMIRNRINRNETNLDQEEEAEENTSTSQMSHSTNINHNGDEGNNQFMNSRTNDHHPSENSVRNGNCYKFSNGRQNSMKYEPCNSTSPPRRTGELMISAMKVSSTVVDYQQSHNQVAATGISRAKIKTIKLTITVIACYIICSSPFIAAQLWACYDPHASESPFYTGTTFTILVLLASLNSAVNPYIFLFFNPNLFQDFLGGLTRRKSRQLVRQKSKSSAVTMRTEVVGSNRRLHQQQTSPLSTLEQRTIPHPHSQQQQQQQQQYN